MSPERYEKLKKAGFFKPKFGKKSGNWKGGITENKDYWVVAKAKRRTLRLKNGGTHTVKEWNDLKEKHNYICANPFCKKKEPEIRLVQDHIVSLKRGGSNDIKNIQPFCKSCNSKKHTKSLCEFLAAYKQILI
ncbi:MAG: HNH endonuclease [Nanoarchaeota archaeon]|nr:HNH endonuclease [Nanoarchaeota archaeon]